MARTAVAVRLRHPGPGLTEQAMPLGLAFACISRHGRAPSTMHGCSHGLPASAPASTRLTSMTVPLDAAACRPAWAGRQRTVGLRRRLLMLCCARGRQVTLLLAASTLLLAFTAVHAQEEVCCPCIARAPFTCTKSCMASRGRARARPLTRAPRNTPARTLPVRHRCSSAACAAAPRAGVDSAACEW